MSAVSHQSCPPLPLLVSFVPQVTVPWQEAPHSALGLEGTALRLGRWGPSLRTGVPPAQGGQDLNRDSPWGGKWAQDGF